MKPARMVYTDFVEHSNGGHGYGAWMRSTVVDTPVCWSCFFDKVDKARITNER